MYGNFLVDEKALFSILFEKILQEFLSESITLDLKKAEAQLIEVLQTMMKIQVPQHPELTKGEETALTIRDQVYHHMDGKINIEGFAKQYKVSEQTLQNAFKSLFGFTPKRFLQLLKLNLVHHDLQNADPATYTVLRIASKWGFTHMGRFSEAYTELFGENPSLTLKSLDYIKGNMIASCTSRKEEMT
jgi:transcriptional regulator GlxA family with amidase domain